MHRRQQNRRQPRPRSRAPRQRSCPVIRRSGIRSPRLPHPLIERIELNDSAVLDYENFLETIYRFALQDAPDVLNRPRTVLEVQDDAIGLAIPNLSTDLVTNSIQ